MLKLPAGQARQVLTPSAVLYVPAEQALQALVPTTEANVPALHWTQMEDEKDPVVLPAVPIGQSMQETVPFA